MNQEIEDLIPAFAIAATDADESKRIRQYLAENPALAAELADFAALAEALLFAAPLVQPSAELELRLQAALNTPATTEKPPPIALEKPKNKRWRALLGIPDWSGRWAMAMASLLFLLLLNGYWFNQIHTLSQTQQQLEVQLWQQSEALSILGMDDAKRISLKTAQADSEIEGDLIWGEGFEVALLYVEKFPQPAPGKVYQLWLVKDGQRTSGGTFSVNGYGNGSLIVQLVQPVASYDSLGITAEPEGGSPNPTSPPLVRAEVEK